MRMVHTLIMTRLSLVVFLATSMTGCADLKLDQVLDVLMKRAPSGSSTPTAPPPSTPPADTVGSSVPTAPAPSTPAPSPPSSPPSSSTSNMAVGELLGTWTNQDGNTSGMTKLIITKVDDNTVGMQGFGKCSPNDCNWGTITTTLSQPYTMGVYQFGFKHTRISVRRAGSELQVQTFDHYTDQSGRQDRTSQYTFVQSPGFHVRPGVLTVPRVMKPQVMKPQVTKPR